MAATLVRVNFRPFWRKWRSFGVRLREFFLKIIFIWLLISCSFHSSINFTDCRGYRLFADRRTSQRPCLLTRIKRLFPQGTKLIFMQILRKKPTWLPCNLGTNQEYPIGKNIEPFNSQEWSTSIFSKPERETLWQLDKRGPKEKVLWSLSNSPN